MTFPARTGWDEPVCGITWGWVGHRDEWTSPKGRASLEALAQTGANWVTLAWSADQDTPQSTTIDTDAPRVVPADQVADTARVAHELGLKVCLKPVVNCADGTWRAYINFLDPPVPGEPSWPEWFADYEEFILGAARVAEEVGAEMLCIGCEMVMADGQEALWRGLIADVRDVYSGLVTYNCDKYQEDRVTWWDAVDVISSSGYYPSGTWPENLERIHGVVERERRPFCFLETGCPSRLGAQVRPNDWNIPGPADEGSQADYLDEMLGAVAAHPWVGGVMLWDWPAVLYEPAEAPENRDYCMYGKRGEAVISEHFARWRAPSGTD